MKIAIVYDRVNKWGGAERVLLALHKMFPRAILYTSVYDSKAAPWARVFPEIKTSFLQMIPWAKKNHEALAFLMPLAFYLFDFSSFDLVISVTSEFAKNIKSGKKTLHLCYCLTPTRYLWSGYDDYFKGMFRILTKPAVYILRIIDLRASKKPDIFVGISTEVKRRIKKYYSRDSEIIFPPVDTKIGKKKNGKYYLLVSRLDYGYKKVDLAIRVFNRINKKLVIVGTGKEEKRLKRLAGRNVKFAGKVSDKKLREIYKNASALVMPQREDFGIVAVEAQGYGVPVIAYKNGGARDTVISGKTGVLFGRQDMESLEKAILRFEKIKFKADNLLNNAKNFSSKKFKQNFVKIIEYERKKHRL